MAEQLRVFVSHSHEDDAFCRTVVQALREAGADVWYDDHTLESGRLQDVIRQELGKRKIFIVLLSKHAFASRQVRRETVLAYELADGDCSRKLLPVTIGHIEASDFAPGTSWLFLADFQRIEAAHYQPYRQEEAIAQVLCSLSLSAASAAPIPMAPPSQSTACAHGVIAYGKVLRDRRSFTEALSVFEHATQVTPWCFCAWSNLGYICSEVGDYEQAFVALGRALRLKRNAPATWANMGLALINLHRCEEGLAAVERALILKPTSAVAWNIKGCALIELRQYTEALPALEQSLILDAKFQQAVQAWINKSSALNSVHRYEEALDAVERALALDLTSPDVWVNKGLALDGLQRYEESLAAAEQALTLDALSPDAVYAWNNKGATLYSLKRYQEALGAYEQALALNNKYLNAWIGKGMTLRALGRTAEAEAAEQSARELGWTG